MTRPRITISATLGVIAAATIVSALPAAAQVQPTAQQPSITWSPAGAPAAATDLRPADPITTPPSRPTTTADQGAARFPTKPGVDLGYVQKAWADPQRAKSKSQSAPGFVRHIWRPDVIMQVNAREGMISVVKFPENESLVQVIVSDPGAFETAIAPNKRSFVLRSMYAGVDGNIIAYGSSGNVYNFYIRSTVMHADTLPDSTVEVAVGGMAASTGETVSSAAALATGTVGAPSDYARAFTSDAAKAGAAFDRGAREYGRVSPLIPERMRANIEIKARSQADAAIAPVRAWHDGKFTYLDFGPNAASMVQWPVASIVVQGVESPVGTRVNGPDRSLMIVEAVGNLTLRNGQYLVCLFAKFENDDNRYSVDPTLQGSRANVNSGVPYRAPAAALSYPQIADAARKMAEARQKEETEAAKKAALADKAAADKRQAEDRARAAALAAEDRKRANAEKAATAARAAAEAKARADAERRAKELEASRPAGTLSASVSLASKAEASAFTQTLRQRLGPDANRIRVAWRDDRGRDTTFEAVNGRAFAIVNGLDATLQDKVCTIARAQKFGCAAIR